MAALCRQLRSRLLPLFVACLVASSCTAVKSPAATATPASQSSTASPASSHEAALVDILAAQSYASEIANLAGTARGTNQIDEGAYMAITAAGMALDAAWRDAAQALIASTGDLQQRLNVMAEKRRNLEAMWNLHKPLVLQQ